jgi:hypothetical protein
LEGEVIVLEHLRLNGSPGCLHELNTKLIVLPVTQINTLMNMVK